MRPNYNHVFWKERFLAGLPPLFAERVKTHLRNIHGGTYDLTHYSYGSLINEITKEGLAHYNDMNLRNQLKKQRRTGKKGVGQFCQQFGYNLRMPKPNSSSKKEKFFKKRNFYKKPHKFIPRKDKHVSTSYKQKSFPRWGAKCTRATKDQARPRNRQPGKQRINQLAIPDNDKAELLKILSEDFEIQSHTSDEDNIHINESSSSFEPQSECEKSKCEFDYYKAIIKMNGLSINTLTQNETFMLDLIDTIADPQAKQEAIERLISLQKDKTSRDFKTDPKEISASPAHTLREVLNRTTPPKPVTLEDLKQEVNNLKSETKSHRT
ncbi:uncharacterized protein LOC120008713 [Tripterygium wilfordii]|uniref:uncharacterized protein LOC120008713 n=1 Tax=Tripterygium wilfordii TaxID=458696 RepID=UPI0018F7E8B0|nr:uncharacterized protein LOC120008713 [Tripterygium wilfordii]